MAWDMLLQGMHCRTWSLCLGASALGEKDWGPDQIKPFHRLKSALGHRRHCNHHGRFFALSGGGDVERGSRIAEHHPGWEGNST